MGFIRDRRGTAMIEFAFVAPVLFMLTIGTIDVGRAVWTASMLDHVARETTRYASVRGSASLNPVTDAQLQTYVNDRLFAVDFSDLTVTVIWTPNNNPGGTVQVQLDYQYEFLLSGLIGLSPIQLQGDSEMVVL